MERTATLLLALLLISTLPAAPARKGQGETAQKKKEEKKAEVLEERISETRHTVRIGGELVRYTARAGNMLLKEEDGTPKAGIFFIAYTKDGVEDVARRPITFSFNGGPGSSSVWLHLGALGPRRVLMDDEGWPLPPPYRLVDNGYSILDLTDLVFIDPVTTGYSRAVPGEDPKQFHGVEEDIESVGEFIRLFTTRFERWASPKFLIGESYGTTRAAGLSGYLQRRHGMYFNGILLVSAILNFQTAQFDSGNDLPYLLHLPTYTAIAWYHKRLPQELQGDLRAALDEAERFVRQGYGQALFQGSRLTEEERQRIARQLARYTGLAPDLIARSDLRISIWQFVEELLRDEGKRVGRLDGRFTRPDTDPQGNERFRSDPSYEAIQGPYTATLNDYVRTELGFESDLPYEILTSRVWPWSFKQYQNRYVDVAATLREAMIQNPYLRVFVASGYYDLATPYFATVYTFDHLGAEAELQDRLQMADYEAGHMMYIRDTSLAKLKEDMADFLRQAVPD